MLRNLLFVATGGAIGSVLRYLVSTNLHKAYPNFSPYGTFTVNMAGCLLIGLLMGWIDSQKLISPQLQLFLVTGFCGSFTTFSTFAHEANFMLFQQKPVQSLLYVGLSVSVGLGLAYLGYRLTKG